MSIEAMNAIAKLHIEPSGRKFVAMALANFADEAWACFPSVRKISEWTALSDKAVRDHLASLETDGFLVRERVRREDGTLGVYRYFIQRQISPVADFASGENFHSPAAKTTAHNHQLEPSIKPSKTRGTRLPANWQPSQAELDFALDTGWEREHVLIEVAKFRDYWIAQPGQKGVKLDWPATWRNWVRRSLPSNRTQPVKEHRNASFIKALAELTRDDAANHASRQQPYGSPATADAGLPDRGNGRTIELNPRSSQWRDF